MSVTKVYPQDLARKWKFSLLKIMKNYQSISKIFLMLQIIISVKINTLVLYKNLTVKLLKTFNLVPIINLMFIKTITHFKTFCPRYTSKETKLLFNKNKNYKNIISRVYHFKKRLISSQALNFLNLLRFQIMLIQLFMRKYVKNK